MRKGISPVIATVLLIAISIISAIGVWYWAAQLVDKPTGVETEGQVFTVTNCEIHLGNPENATLTVRNTGGLMITDSSVSVYENGDHATDINFTKAPDGVLEPDEVALIDVEHVGEGFEEEVEYTVIDPGSPIRRFRCSTE